jgi:hypothetical protein
MMKPICWILVLALAGCAAVPDKYQSRKIGLCESGVTSFIMDVPYNRVSSQACAVAVAPVDAGFWYESPYNSHQIRGHNTVTLGCRPLVPAAGDCDYSGLPGHSQTLMLNFDPSVYHERALVRRAVLAVYTFDNPRGLFEEAQLEGRLNVGGDMQNLARQREVWARGSGADKGWVFFDVTAFTARAINERRNSVHCEVSLPCRAADQGPVTVGLLEKEPRLVVEFE